MRLQSRLVMFVTMASLLKLIANLKDELAYSYPCDDEYTGSLSNAFDFGVVTDEARVVTEDTKSIGYLLKKKYLLACLAPLLLGFVLTV